ncbi:reverse transcriptase domain-containing protein [Tanacetum coccineum]
MEVNADDMVIKIDSEEEMLADTEETLGRLKAINLKLNPRKCSFGVEEGIYSGHLITKQGIRADPSKVPLEKHKEGPPFHKNPEKLHEWKDGSVDNRSKRSLLKNERMLRVTANNGYTNQRKGEETGSRIFCKSDTTPSRKKYPELEKLILALVYAARKLRRYFQVHPIQVISDMPIKQVLAKPEKSGRVAKWAIELGEHEIEFKDRNSIKGQLLPDFLAETSPMERE